MFLHSSKQNEIKQMEEYLKREYRVYEYKMIKNSLSCD